MAETRKAATRRAADPRWAGVLDPTKIGLDIGSGADPLNHTFRRYDQARGDGDATFLNDIPAETFEVVYASHVLEHLHQPTVAVSNWWRVLKPGGLLAVIVPHRDLYEKRLTLPSRWNEDHKHFYLPDRAEPPHTLNFAAILRAGVGVDAEQVLFQVADAGWQDVGPDLHSGGEYSIEAVFRKPAGG
jgi:SAM-dependent methyltransferase